MYSYILHTRPADLRKHLYHGRDNLQYYFCRYCHRSIISNKYNSPNRLLQTTKGNKTKTHYEVNKVLHLTRALPIITTINVQRRKWFEETIAANGLTQTWPNKNDPYEGLYNRKLNTIYTHWLLPREWNLQCMNWTLTLHFVQPYQQGLLARPMP